MHGHIEAARTGDFALRRRIRRDAYRDTAALFPVLLFFPVYRNSGYDSGRLELEEAGQPGLWPAARDGGSGCINRLPSAPRAGWDHHGLHIRNQTWASQAVITSG